MLATARPSCYNYWKFWTSYVLFPHRIAPDISLIFGQLPVIFLTFTGRHVVSLIQMRKSYLFVLRQNPNSLNFFVLCLHLMSYSLSIRPTPSRLSLAVLCKITSSTKPEVHNVSKHKAP